MAQRSIPLLQRGAWSRCSGAGPLAALRCHAGLGHPASAALAALLLALTTAIVAGVFGLTLRALGRGTLLR